MNKTVRFSLALAFVWVFFGSAMASDHLPKMSGNISCPECSDAFRLATFMFKSKSARLYAPLIIPDAMNSELVLGATDLDISGGDALKSNQRMFKKIPMPRDSSPRSMYLGKHLGNGVRIVVKETPHGWRGDTYSLYMLKANVSQKDFLNETEADYNKSEYSALIEDTWRPPLIFVRKSTPKMWFLVVGEPYEVLADWTVYRETSNGYEKSCIIRFHPEMKNATSLLPKSVQHFEHLLDETIGPGYDEGTLQPTARLRLTIQHVWANAALRPWALSESDTYNSAEEVKTGLITWSKNGKSYERIFKEIMRIYPLAEHDLSDYYMQQFHLPKNKADKLAKWILDIAFRSHYAFSNGGDYFRYDNVNTNPWSEDFKEGHGKKRPVK